MVSSKFIVMALALIAASTYARTRGGAEGNGGDVVVCEVLPGRRTIELFDFYEARTSGSGYKINLGSKELSVSEKIDLVLNRLENTDWVRRANWKKAALTFDSNAKFVTGVELPIEPDHGTFILEAGCQLKRVVGQNATVLPHEKKFVVKKELWDLLDNDTKAGLILHEVIYAEALQYGALNSKLARYFNEDLCSENGTIKTMSFKEYKEFLKMVQFRFAFVGTSAWTEWVEMNSDGTYSAQGPTWHEIHITSGPNILLASQATFDTRRRLISANNYYNSGGLKVGKFSFQHSGTIYFYPNGEISATSGANAAWQIAAPIDGKSIRINIGAFINSDSATASFFDTGEIQCGFVMDPVGAAPKENFVTFSKDGRSIQNLGPNAGCSIPRTQSEGSVLVHIHGSVGFCPSGSTVTVSGVPCTPITVISPDHITCWLPKETPLIDIVVTKP